MKAQRALTVAACVLLLAAAYPADKAADEWKMVAGKWQPTKMEIDGNPLPADDVKEFLVVLGDGKYSAKRNDETIDEGAVTLDPEKKPKQMDLKASVGDNKDKVRKGIYEVKGDTMKFVIAPPDKDRPTKFESPAGEGFIYIEYKKAK